MDTPQNSRFTVQRLDPHGWTDLRVTESWAEVRDTLVEHQANLDDQGVEHDPDWVGWIVARSSHLSVHSRKDGRWRILERPADAQEGEG